MPICLSIVGLEIGYLGSKSQTNGIAKERALRNNGGWATTVMHTRGLPEGNRKTSSCIISRRTFSIWDIKYISINFYIFSMYGYFTKFICLLFFQVDLMPGVVRLLEHLSRCKIPMALATSSSKEYLGLKTSKRHADMFRSKSDQGKQDYSNLGDIWLWGVLPW